MVSLINTVHTNKDPKIHLIVMRGINNVITLLLKLGIHFKINEGVHDPSKWLDLQTTRKIVIKHDYDYFRNLIKYLCINKYYKSLFF